MPMNCPHCRAVLHIPPELKGAKIRCNQCGKVLSIKSSSIPPTMPAVSGVYDDEPQQRIQSQPVRAVPPRPVSDARRGSESAPQRKSYGIVVLAGLLLFCLLVVGVVGAGGLAWWFLRGPGPTQRARVNVPVVNDSTEIEPTPLIRSNSDGQLSREMLNYLKGVMAYVKVDVGEQHASGSGFLIKANGDIGYFITNHHVVTAGAREADQGDQRPAPAPPRIGPQMPFGPFGNVPQLPSLPPIFELSVIPQAVKTKITVVLGSGTSAERSYPAEVVDADEGRDLALLKITAPNLPPAIDLTKRAVLKETAPVFTIGYPFGSMLALNQNPEVSIGKATISSVRRDDKEKTALVQLQGDLNPGNSGGPVVDPDGRLVGIAVAHIRDTQIGLAIAPDILEEMLHRGKASLRVNAVKFEKENRELEFVVEILDLFDSLAEVQVLFAPSAAVPGDAKPLDDSGYAPMANSKSVTLKADGNHYSARAAVAPTELKGFLLPVQLVYVERNGKTYHGRPHNQLLRFTGSLPSFDVVFAGGPNTASRMSSNIRGRSFTFQYWRPGIVFTLNCAIVNRTAKLSSIEIIDGSQVFTANKIEALPEQYQVQAQVLLASKHVQYIADPQAASREPKPPPPANETTTPPPATDLFAKGSCVYVADLQEYAVKSGPAPFAKGGAANKPRVWVLGRPSPKGLSMYPPAAPGIASAKYRLDKQAAVFKTTVALDQFIGVCLSPAIFTVWGDGKMLFQSYEISSICTRAQECSVDVAGVEVLELRVSAVGRNDGLQIVWFEPRLLQRVDTADPEAQIPKKLFETGPVEFLTDLTERVMRGGPRMIGKQGQLGDHRSFIAVKGRRYFKAMGMPPPQKGFAAIRYQLDKQAAIFKGAVGIDGSNRIPTSSGVFEIYGDGKRLWQSAKFDKDRVGPVEFQIDVAGVTELELRTIAEPSAEADTAPFFTVWLEPRLLQKRDTPDPTFLQPTKLFEKGGREYLSDLPESNLRLDASAFGKNGITGSKEPIAASGKPSPKGLGTQPPLGTNAAISYQLDKKAARFKGAAALNDSKASVLSPAIFEVYGDGKRLWQTEVAKRGVEVPFDIDVSGVEFMELRVSPKPHANLLNPVWIEPRLLQKSDTPDQ